VSDEIILRRATGLLSRNAGRGLLLAFPEGDGIEWLSPSASIVWEALAEPRTQEDLIHGVAHLVEKPPDQVRDGVRTLISRLRARGLVIDDAAGNGQRESARS
jgi:urease gamma subunit